MKHILVTLFGQLGTVLQGDPGVFDRFRWLKKNLLSGPVRTLDAGSGSGAFSLYAAKQGNEVIGFSFDEPKNVKARKRAAMLDLHNVTFVEGDLRKLRNFFRHEKKFDQIICFETIEHIKDDTTLLHDFAYILKPGGTLILTAPYEYYRRLPGDNISDIENGGHMRWGYTHKGFKMLTDKAGLTIIKAGYVSGFITRTLLLAERLLGRLVTRRLARILLLPTRLLHYIDPLVTRVIRYPFLTVTFVIKKPLP